MVIMGDVDKIVHGLAATHPSLSEVANKSVNPQSDSFGFSLFVLSAAQIHQTTKYEKATQQHMIEFIGAVG
jgi:hypothetical protein